MATLDDLRVLARHLSPGFHINAHEVEDILSALVQVAEHGQPLIEAAHVGAQAVADFYHEAISAHARANDLPEPPKGAPVESAPAVVAGQPAPVAAAAGITPQQLDQLVKAAVAAALSATKDEGEPAGEAKTETPASEQAEPHRGPLSGLADIFGGHE